MAQIANNYSKIQEPILPDLESPSPPPPPTQPPLYMCKEISANITILLKQTY